MWNRSAVRFFKIVIPFLVFIFFLEMGIKIFNLDIAALFVNRSVVGFSSILGFDIHRPSHNADLLIELIPNTHVKFPETLASPYEKKYKDYNISINSLGFRGPEFKVKKPSDIFRVFFIGGSNTFAMVDDEDTYTAQLQKRLNNKFPGKFEIINAGISGSVTSQNVFFAEEILKTYSPDLIVFQKTNVGRRPFVMDDPHFAEHFEKNPELYQENIPDVFSEKDLPTNFHYKLVKYFATYRLFASVYAVFKWRSDCINKNFEADIKHCLYFNGSANKSFSNYGDYVSNREFSRFLNSHQEIPLVLFQPLIHGCYFDKSKTYPRIYEFQFCNIPDKPEYSDLHPPSHVYSWYAEQLELMVLKFYNEKNTNAVSL